jgi:phosphate transport system protein
MPRSDYQQRLAWLKTEVVLMAELVVDRYTEALAAVSTGDRWLADQVLEGDTDINERYLELEAECVDLIALEQPVASDLRLITASFKIITDLERIGDLATNLADYTRAGRSGIHPTVDISSLGGTATEMIQDAVAAYESTNAEACLEIAQRDDTLDADCERTNQRIIRGLLTEDSNAENQRSELTAASRGLLTVRDIERVGDHAVNICARTRYMIDGDDKLLY